MVKPATVPETDANHPDAAGAPAAPKQRRRTKYEDAGVPADYLGPKGQFKVGHDAKYKSALINTVLGPYEGEQPSAEMIAEAEAMLAKLGWTHHLDASRKSRQARTERAERKAADKAAKAEAEANQPNANDQVEGHIAARKTAKAHEGQDREVEVDGETRIVKVLKVARQDKNDVNSPFVAKVEWFDDPANGEGRHQADGVLVSDLRELAQAS